MSSRKPYLSVCIPTYNRAHLLGRAIESVLDQDFTDFELIVSDNASTDKTEEVVKCFNDPRIRYRRNSGLMSMYANHNRCAALASAGWLVFLHSDDRLRPGALRTYNRVVTMRPSLAAIGAPGSFRFDSMCLGQSEPMFVRGLHAAVIFFRHSGISPSGTAYRAEALGKLGGFDEHSIFADYDFWLRMSEADLEIALIQDDVLDVGESDRTITPLFHSCEFEIEMGRIIGRHLRGPLRDHALGESMLDWEPKEVATLLRNLACAQDDKLLEHLEQALSRGRMAYRRDYTYWHVRTYRLLGHRMHIRIVRWIRKLRSVVYAWRRGATRRKCRK